jgi:hypothetical protein
MGDVEYLREKCLRAAEYLSGIRSSWPLDERIAAAWSEIRLGVGDGRIQPTLLPDRLAEPLADLRQHVAGDFMGRSLRFRSQEQLQCLAEAMSDFCELAEICAASLSEADDA